MPNAVQEFLEHAAYERVDIANRCVKLFYNIRIVFYMGLLARARPISLINYRLCLVINWASLKLYNFIQITHMRSLLRGSFLIRKLKASDMNPEFFSSSVRKHNRYQQTNCVCLLLMKSTERMSRLFLVKFLILWRTRVLVNYQQQKDTSSFPFPPMSLSLER